jgi:hypothetical protein
MNAATTCLAAFVAVLSAVELPATGQDSNIPKVNVVLFTPADVKPPGDAVQRLTQVGNYTETFLAKWMKQWGYPPVRERFLERNPDGSVRVLFVSGKEPLASGKYGKPGFEAEVWNQATPKYNLRRHRHVWWIWVYLGDPPLRFQGFEGRGTVSNGGNAFANYLNVRGEIRVTDPLGAPFLDEFSLKGAMHELGHGLGLPHDGPLERQALGMPLMGATIANYRTRTRSKETQGYLSPASAAMLWRHPVFSGTAKDRDLMPSFTVSGLETIHDAATNSVKLRGALKSDIGAHSVVVLDSVPGVHETYWQKSYVARIGVGGQFEVQITEPSAKSGTLRILFCFENGAVTGDGKDYGVQGTLEKPYRASNRGYQITP